LNYEAIIKLSVDESLKARFYCYIAKTIAARLSRTTKLLAVSLFSYHQWKKTKANLVPNQQQKALLAKSKEKNKANKKQKELIEYRIMLGISAAEPILKGFDAS